MGVVSEGVQAVIRRAEERGSDLLLEGVHFIPGNRAIESWREAGGLAAGIVLFVEDEVAHREMISDREQHPGKRVEHSLGNLDRIRSIQDEMIDIGSECGWIMIDPTADGDPSGELEGLLGG